MKKYSWVQDENNLSLVMLAGQKGLEEMCLYLLEEDPSMVNARAEDGATALMLGNSHYIIIQGYILCISITPRPPLYFRHLKAF